MNKTTKAYIYSVIAAGGLVLAGSLASGSWPDPRAWAIYLVLTVLAAVPKLRLPSMEGTYSLGFLFMLYGVAHFGLAETLVAACASSLAGSFLNTQKRSTLVQVLFNIANLAVSVSACFLLAHVWLAAEMASDHRALSRCFGGSLELLCSGCSGFSSDRLNCLHLPQVVFPGIPFSAPLNFLLPP